LNKKSTLAIVAVAIILIGVFGYVYLASPAGTVTLNGSGATFPYPLLSSMISGYTHNVATDVLVNYQAIGSGGGISALQGKTVDFAGSDAPLSASERANAPNALHIPETIGAVTIAYKLPNILTGLHLTGSVIADIFAGHITMWNDTAIQNLNPDKTLPAQSILVIHRSDGSGTTFIFTGYLSASSSSWNSSIGQGKTVE
jgi:phosphate transport system substrate-binding protein